MQTADIGNTRSQTWVTLLAWSSRAGYGVGGLCLWRIIVGSLSDWRWLKGVNFRALCLRFGVSAKTGDKWLARFEALGEAGLVEHARRPLGSPAHSPDGVEALVPALRAVHPAGGGRKLAAGLVRKGAAPSPSIVTAILRRHGVTLGVFGGGAKPCVRFEGAQPNDLWQIDLKGHVSMREGRLHPLTVLDDRSRFALVTAACADQTTETVKAQLISAFRRYGLPVRITCVRAL